MTKPNNTNSFRLSTLTLAMSLSACASSSPSFNAPTPPPPPKPSALTPQPSQPYSEIARANISNWRKKLTATPSMLQPSTLRGQPPQPQESER